MSKKVTMLLTDAASEEADRLAKLSGLSIPDLFRLGMSLVWEKILAEATSQTSAVQSSTTKTKGTE